MRTWLKEFRLAKDLTQEQVAERAGIARTTYAMYEQGARNPNIVVAVKISDLLNFKWTLFFEDKVHVTRNDDEVS